MKTMIIIIMIFQSAEVQDNQYTLAIKSVGDIIQVVAAAPFKKYIF